MGRFDFWDFEGYFVIICFLGLFDSVYEMRIILFFYLDWVLIIISVCRGIFKFLCVYYFYISFNI